MRTTLPRTSWASSVNARSQTGRKKLALRSRVQAASVDEGESATRIYESLEQRYGAQSIKRVLDSLSFAAAGHEYTRFHPGQGLQKAASYIAGLSATPFHKVSDSSYKWMQKLEDKHNIIKEELTRALLNPELSTIGNQIWVVAAREEAVAYGPDWKTLVLQDRCVWEEKNETLFPKTVALIRELQVPSVEVFFARQAPGTGIKPHSDDTNFILTSHLALDVPEGECWMQVGDFKKNWENGKGMIADTSFIHSTFNESTTATRYVLIIRFWHPELTSDEIKALQFLFDALNDPSVSGIAAALSRADKREGKFPQVKQKKRRGSGDGLGLLSKGMK